MKVSIVIRKYRLFVIKPPSRCTANLHVFDVTCVDFDDSDSNMQASMLKTCHNAFSEYLLKAYIHVYMFVRTCFQLDV